MATTTRFDFAGAAASAEVIVALLAELPFDAFETEGEALPTGVTVRAYAKTANVDAGLREAVAALAGRCGATATEEVLPDVNYNARWEADYPPVELGDFLRIRAPFHQEGGGFAHELVVVPEMSFGTGHHATTALMAEYLRDAPPAGKAVFELGTGTGVLAILASRLGATRVDATDIDGRCVASALANAARNGVALGEVRVGTEADLPRGPYDLVLANINRAVLLAAMGELAARLAPDGELWLSGILASDLDAVDGAAFDAGLTRRERRRRGDWLACRYGRTLTDRPS